MVVGTNGGSRAVSAGVGVVAEEGCGMAAAEEAGSKALVLEETDQGTLDIPLAEDDPFFVGTAAVD